MTRQNNTTLLTVLAIATPLAGAEVSEFVVAKVRFYQQESVNPPSEVEVYVFHAFIDSLDGDAGGATVNGSTPMSETLPGEWLLDVVYGSQAALDNAWPGAQSYDLDLSGGLLGSRHESLALVNPEVYPGPSALTPSSYTAAQGASANEDLLIEWVTPDSNTDFVILEISSTDGEVEIVDERFDPAQTSFLIPAAALDAGRTYLIEMVAVHGSVFSGQVSPGFGPGAVGLAGYGTVTALTFTTSTSCSADLNDDGLVDFFDVQAFLNFYASGDLRADFTPDGVLDFFDVQAFLNAYASGCP
jgi:hypothetical protein